MHTSPHDENNDRQDVDGSLGETDAQFLLTSREHIRDFIQAAF